MPKRRTRLIEVSVPPVPVTLRQKFESWVASWFPGFKTRAITGLSAIGGLAASMQGFITGLPLDQFITAKNLAIVMAVLFTLSYWFKSLGERYNVPPEVD